MKSLSTFIKSKANQIQDGGAWVWLLEITLGTQTFRLAMNNETVTLTGVAYSPYVFDLEPVDASLKGNLPRIVLRVSNVGRYLEPYLHTYNGGIGSTVTLRIAYVLNAIAYTVGIEEMFTIAEAKADAQWVYLTLAITDPLTRRFPRDRYIANMCRHRFKSALCRYTGSAPTCDHTLTQCIEYENQAQYGGSPGVAEGVYV